MAAKVEVCSGMYSLQLLEAERECKLYICCRICIVRKFVVVVESVFVISKTYCLMPG